MFKKFGSLGTVDKGWECGHEVAGEDSNCPQGFLGSHPLFQCLGFLGDVRTVRELEWQGFLYMLSPQWKDRCEDNSASQEHQQGNLSVSALALGRWKISSKYLLTTGLVPCRFGDWIHTIFSLRDLILKEQFLVTTLALRSIRNNFYEGRLSSCFSCPHTSCLLLVPMCSGLSGWVECVSSLLSLITMKWGWEAPDKWPSPFLNGLSVPDVRN